MPVDAASVRALQNPPRVN